MLAVVHHLLVTERVPLPEILSLARSLTTKHALIEFVSPEDSMFQKLCRGREALFSGLDQKAFEAALAPFFCVEDLMHVPGSARWLYRLVVRDS